MSDLKLYVIETRQSRTEFDEVAEIPGKATELHSDLIRRWFRSSATEVSADKLLESFDNTQRVIDALLETADSQGEKGYRLEEFEVSLAVTGEGTIGFVTASAQAGVVLKFRRASSDN